MARHGNAYFPAEVGNFTYDSGEQAMMRLIREHPDVDGVFVANDLMAQGALMALRDAGRRVPEDVAVVGSTTAVRHWPPGRRSPRFAIRWRTWPRRARVSSWRESTTRPSG